VLKVDRALEVKVSVRARINMAMIKVWPTLEIIGTVEGISAEDVVVEEVADGNCGVGSLMAFWVHRKGARSLAL